MNFVLCLGLTDFTHTMPNQINPFHMIRMIIVAILLQTMTSGLISAQSGGPSLVSFTLINADTDGDIGDLNDGDTLILSQLPTSNLNVRANTSPTSVDKVIFDFDGVQNYRSESSAPYALAGDKKGDYNDWTPSAGAHVLSAKARDNNVTGPSYTVNFFVITQASVDCHGDINGTAYFDDCGVCVGGNTGLLPDQDKDSCGVCFGDGSSCVGCSGPEIVSLSLINTINNADLGTIEDGDTIDETQLFNFSIRANACDQTTRSVEFIVDGNVFNIDNGAPFAINGNSNGFYNAWNADSGMHVISAVPYPQSGATGLPGPPITLNLLVIDSVQADTTGYGSIPNEVCGLYPGGRIALTFDGNIHDSDDYVSLPMAMAMLYYAGLKDSVVHIEYNIHLGITDSVQEYEMRVSAKGGRKRFHYDESIIYDAISDPDSTSDALAAAINASTASSPLWILAGGPMEMIARGLEKSDSLKRKYVKIVSHSDWNQNHDHFGPPLYNDWSDLLSTYSADSVQFIEIPDMNGGSGFQRFKSPRSQWRWLINDPDTNFHWLYGLNRTPAFDCSDAGMAYWLLSGFDTLSGASECRALFESPCQIGCSCQCDSNILSTGSMVSPNDSDLFAIGTSFMAVANVTDPDSNTAFVEFYVGDSLQGVDSTNTYSFNITGLDSGYHEIYVQAVDTCGERSRTDTITVFVRDTDCAGVSGGSAYLDDCGICVGGNTGVLPDLDKDTCGVCFGNDMSCAPIDCHGDTLGTAYVDSCGICAGGNTGLVPNASCLDCDGVIHGTASMDTCGVCSGGTTGIIPGATCNDCNGDVYGSAYIDSCGVCAEGNTGVLANQSCTDCAGVVNGTASIDNCGDCTGGTTGFTPNANCTDCNNVLGGSAFEDSCGVCAGGNTGIVPNVSCTDCAGVINGGASLDTCGICSGGATGIIPGSTCSDCNGDPHGSALIDSCGVCAEGNTGITANENCTDCAGIVNGSASLDTCGICSGGATSIIPGASCSDCNGDPYGSAFVDSCGVCAEGNTGVIANQNCTDCAGIVYGAASIDSCGVCAGGSTGIIANSTCTDCNGIINGSALVDSCGICSGGNTGTIPNATCTDCFGNINGTAFIDSCGTCAGGNTGINPNSTCLDCNGMINGTASLDTCGVCTGGSTGLIPGASCSDCHGNPYGTASIDSCDVCSGGNTGILPNASCTDCNGDVNGSALKDTCGVCAGGNTAVTPGTSCSDCYGDPYGTATLDSCGICSGGNTGIVPNQLCVGCQSLEVVSLTLMTAGTASTPIRQLVNGDVLYLSLLGPFSVRADICNNGIVGSVRFHLNGNLIQNENAAPYAINGDKKGDFKVWNISPGTYTLTATPHSNSNGGGNAGIPETVSFVVFTDPPTTDCNGDPNGTAYIDACGECTGGNTGLVPNASCMDCNGLVNGTAIIDNCGVCSGGNTGITPNSTCTDCAGIPGGGAYIDSCGNCVGGSTGKQPNVSCTDCNGVINGVASIDACGICAGGNTGIIPDQSCVDCAGVPNGTAIMDTCNICAGGTTGIAPNLSCITCDPIEVTALMLIDASSNTDLGVMKNGDTINLGTLPLFSIRADVCSEEVSSVIFHLNANKIRTENLAPYAVNGDNNGNYKSWPIGTGDHNLEAIPYSANNGNGTVGISKAVTFHVIDSQNSSRTVNGRDETASDNKRQGLGSNSNTIGTVELEYEAFSVSVYPNPTTGLLHILITPATAESTIEVYDATGKMLLKHKQDGEDTAIDLSPYASGMYWIKVRSAENVNMIRVNRH